MTDTEPARALIKKTGALCTLQDRGRNQCMHLGLCPGGAADAYAFHWANRLLDNPENAACLEITLGPCEIEFTHITQIAVCGASGNMRLNGQPLLPWSTHRVEEGSILRCPIPRHGLRYYLAIKGGFAGDIHFGSRSGLTANGDLKHIKSGEILGYDTVEPNQFVRNRSTHWQLIPDYQEELLLAVIASYQHAQFSKTARETLFKQSYRVSKESNRMGYRLEGAPIEWSQEGIVSEGIAYGSIQIPPDGQPIILLNDRQTIGGYPKIGCVTAEDCFQLAQRRPGQSVRFIPADENP